MAVIMISVVVNHVKQIDIRRIYLYGINAADQWHNLGQDLQ
jgi:hypothetical protein